MYIIAFPYDQRTSLPCLWKNSKQNFAFSLALTPSSSFSLAAKVQASLTLARSCVGCTIFNLLRSFKIGCTSEPLGRRPKIKSKGLKSNTQNKFGISFGLHYL